jgi:hypothetical protein
MRQGSCEECQRLFEEYRAALMECIKLDGRLHMAKLSNDTEAMDRGSDALAEANARRDNLRNSIREHETVAHPDDN